MLVAMLIISVMTPGAVVAEYQDNQAVVSAVQLLRSSDPRFQEGILLREAILERGKLDSRPRGRRKCEILHHTPKGR